MAKEYKQKSIPVFKAELLMAESQKLQFTWSMEIAKLISFPRWSTVHTTNKKSLSSSSRKRTEHKEVPFWHHAEFVFLLFHTLKSINKVSAKKPTQDMRSITTSWVKGTQLYDICNLKTDLREFILLLKKNQRTTTLQSLQNI